MPDYVRIGPPWGMINWLPNSGLRSLGDGGATYPATAMGWSASGGSCATTNVASWGLAATQYGYQRGDGLPGGWQPYRPANNVTVAAPGGWGIYSATTIPSGQILAVAEFPVPSVRGIWTFQGQVYGGSNTAVWGQVQVLATGASAWASWNVATARPSTAAQNEPGTFRWTGQFPNAMVATPGSQTMPSQPPGDMDRLRLLIRAGNTIASGDSIHITQLGLFQLDAQFPLSAAAIGSIYAGATQDGGLIGRPFSNRARDAWAFSLQGLCARYPAHPSYDARQPVGQAIEIGSWLREGFDYGGAGVERRSTQDTSLTDAGALAFEGYSPRIWTLPYIVDTVGISGGATAVQSGDFQGAIDKAIESDPLTLDVITEGGTWLVRFDVHTVSHEPDSVLPYRRQQLADGRLIAQTAPIGYTQRPIVPSTMLWGPGFQAVPSFLGNGLPGVTSFVQFQTQIFGDRSAYLISKSGIANSQQNPQTLGFLMGYQPGATAAGPFWAASYIPSTGSAASMPNGLMGAGGSQVKFSAVASAPRVAGVFMIPPNAVAALPDTVRVLLMAGNATAATVQLFAAMGKIVGPNVGASAFAVATSQVGFMNPLVTAVASEPQSISVVDLGEMTLGKSQKGFGQAPAGFGQGGNNWLSVAIYAGTSASNASNGFAGALDSLLLLPAGPSCFIFGVPSVGYIANASGPFNSPYQTPMSFSMHPSYGVYLDPMLMGPSGVNMNNQLTFNYDGPAPIAADTSALMIGPYPLLPPGLGHMTFLSLSGVRSPGESVGGQVQIATSRPITGTGAMDFTFGSAQENTWFYFPRWSFIK